MELAGDVFVRDGHAGLLQARGVVVALVAQGIGAGREHSSGGRTPVFFASGRRVAASLTFRGLPPAESFIGFTDRPAYADARRIAERFNALPPGAVRETKRLMRRGRNAALLETIGVENATFASRLQSPEAKEAFSAFFQKRKPDFSQF